jgi:hypothetical protein
VRVPPVEPPAVTSTVRVRAVAPDPSPPARGRRRRARRPAPRRLLVAVVSGAALFLAVAGGVVWGHRSQSSAAVLPKAAAVAAPTARPTPAALDWLAVMRSLEATRARALTAGDSRLLYEVYVDGSPLLAADAATLRRLAAKGQRVDGFSMTPLRVDVVDVSPSQVTLYVTDELSAYTLSDRRTVRHIAATSPRTVTIVLLNHSGLWRIAKVHP